MYFVAMKRSMVLDSKFVHYEKTRQIALRVHRRAVDGHWPLFK